MATAPVSNDYYKALNLNRTATLDDIRSSYRKLALKYHPFVAGENNDAIAKFYMISESYDVLGDPKLRSVYDNFGVDGLSKGIPSEIKVEQQESKHTGNYQFNADKALLNFEKFFGTKNPFDGIFSITNSLLSKPEAIKNLDGSFGKFGTSLPIEKAPVIVQELPVTLEELYKGAFKKLQIERKLVNKQSPENTYTETKQFTVEIKRGWRDGTKVVFAGQGNQSAKLNDGDVVFVVKQLPHERFKRNGNNLVTVKRIGLADALTGANFNIETLDGRELMTQIHDVITPKYSKIVPGEGMPVSGKSDSKGDLEIQFDIEYPLYLDEDQKLLLREALKQ